MEDERLPLPPPSPRCPPTLLTLISRMWTRDPSERPGAAEVAKQLALIQATVSKPSRATSVALTVASDIISVSAAKSAGGTSAATNLSNGMASQASNRV